MITTRDVRNSVAGISGHAAGEPSPKRLKVAHSVTFDRDRKHIIDLAARHRLPAIYEWSRHVHEGGFTGYGMNSEQPTAFELAVNLKTAKTLGLVLPPSVLARAGLLIE